MATSTREEFKSYCLRALGQPVIDINVDDEQVDDRVDEALKYYFDYHFDGSSKVYYKHQVTSNNINSAVHDLIVKTGGTAYSNSDTLTFTATDIGKDATGHIVTDDSGAIVDALLDTNGLNYGNPPTITINTSTGSGATIVSELGGFIELPENIMGAVGIFDISSAMNMGGIFSIQYQIIQADLINLASASMVPYVMQFTHLRMIEELLVGKQPIRYNRHKNRLHVDTNWERFGIGNYLIVEAYEVVDPDVYTDVWNDRWLKRYAEALIKRQWGNNLKKFSGMPLPGGQFFNGQQIFDEAEAEITKLEDEMINSYSLPVSDMTG